MKRSKKRKIESITVKEFVDDYIYRIDLDADYQREKIWTRKNQEELIDSIIEDIDIPKIYLTEIDSDSFDYECIDGKQRMSALLAFFKPDPGDDILKVRVAGEKLTYKELRKKHPTIADKIDDFELTVVIYPEVDDDLVREIFRRLQLGIRLNSGELLNSYTGTIRDFVFDEIGKDGPFVRNTGLSIKRYSRQFTLAQICINSFSRSKTGEFVRARFQDLEDFFRDNERLRENDENLERIRKILRVMDKHFADASSIISSRAIAVSAYLFVEELVGDAQSDMVSSFGDYFVKLLDLVNEDLERLTDYEKPKHPYLLEEFQKYISQASVEPYAIKRRHHFLKTGFAYFIKTKGKMLTSDPN